MGITLLCRLWFNRPWVVLILRSPESYFEFEILNPCAVEHGWGWSSDRLTAPRPGGQLLLWEVSLGPCLWTGLDRQSRSSGTTRPQGSHGSAWNLGKRIKRSNHNSFWPRSWKENWPTRKGAFPSSMVSFQIPEPRFLTLSVRSNYCLFHYTWSSFSFAKFSMKTEHGQCTYMSEFQVIFRFLNPNLNTSLSFIFVLIEVWESFLKSL